MTVKETSKMFSKVKMADTISDNLSTVSSVILIFGIVLSIGLAIAGLIFTFSNSWLFGGFGVFVSLVVVAVIVALNYFGFYAMSALFLGLASIVYSSSLSANIAVSSCIDDSSKKEVVDSKDWQCKKCGAINSHYVTTCACGEIKPR